MPPAPSPAGTQGTHLGGKHFPGKMPRLSTKPYEARCCLPSRGVGATGEAGPEQLWALLCWEDLKVQQENKETTPRLE